MSKAKEILNKAIAYIKERGWAQRKYETKEGACCALGAIHLATTDGRIPWGVDETVSEEMYYAYLVARQALNDQLPRPGIPNWNDVEGRTVEEVLAAFEKAAEAVSGKEEVRDVCRPHSIDA